MNCKNVKQNLVFFLKHELSQKRQVEIENHLKSCPGCSHLLDEFSQLWEAVEHREKIQPSPYFRTRLKQRINEHEKGRNFVWDRFEGLVRWTRPAIAVAVLLIGIFLGYSLGNFNGKTESPIDARTMALQQFFDSHYLTALDDVPAGTIEETYLRGWD